MDLILWRHAEAFELREGENDLERALTPKGERQAQRMAQWLNQHLPASTKVLASPARRTQQTAQALERRFKTVDALAPDASARISIRCCSTNATISSRSAWICSGARWTRNSAANSCAVSMLSPPFDGLARYDDGIAPAQARIVRRDLRRHAGSVPVSGTERPGARPARGVMCHFKALGGRCKLFNGV